MDDVGDSVPIYKTRVVLDSDVAALSQLEPRFYSLKPYLQSNDPSIWLMQVHLAVHELITNIILHAYSGRAGKIDLTLALYPDHVHVDIYDSGSAFTRLDIPVEPLNVEEPPESGYGLQILEAVMDTVEYTRLEEGRNHWRLTRRL